MRNILIVLSAADTWTRVDGSAYESGIWAEELVVMDETFIDAGFRVDIATPRGIAPTMDARSLDPAVALWDAVGAVITLFTPAECANYFKAAGYEPD